MPETAIGLFPDVGASFFLPRLDGELGTFLGMTCHRLQGVEVFLSGIATHYMPHKRIPALLDALTNIETDNLVEINRVLEKFSEPLSIEVWRKWSLGGSVANAIDRCFKLDTVEDIIEALIVEERTGNEEDVKIWARRTLEELKAVSPTSLKVTLEQLRRGRHLDIASCFRMEHRMVQGFLQTPDFFEGVTSRLVDKRAPVWSPTFDGLTSISRADILQRYFEPFAPSVESVKPARRVVANAALPSQTLTLTSQTTYFEYPHRTLSGLPTDRDVKAAIAGKLRRGLQGAVLTRPQDVVEAFEAHWGAVDTGLGGTDPSRLPRALHVAGGRGKGKKGLREKIVSVLERRGGVSAS
ncbi:hypothetical protein HDU84_005359 [Entophlyctis sp. JEL0112]|nr:hypothetical protein HDU84_005359 [Entophlyctis sp. JEL0112]